MGMEEYPQPVPVNTTTMIMHHPSDRLRIVAVRLTSGLIVLPGAIVEHWKNEDAVTARDRETREETGRCYAEKPLKFVTDLRTTTDLREWLGVKTNHCNDIVWAGPIEDGKFEPVDVEEVAGAFWLDVNTKTVKMFGRGHGEVLILWRNYVCAGVRVEDNLLRNCTEVEPIA